MNFQMIKMFFAWQGIMTVLKAIYKFIRNLAIFYVAYVIHPYLVLVPLAIELYLMWEYAKDTLFPFLESIGLLQKVKK